MALSKSDIVEKMAAKMGLSKSKSDEIVSFVFETVEEELKKGEKVSIVSFGTFEVRVSKARMGRNPKTGETISIPEKKSVKFKAGKGLKEMVR
jgi:DNA-binding protein HU-beta